MPKRSTVRYECAVIKGTTFELMTPKDGRCAHYGVLCVVTNERDWSDGTVKLDGTKYLFAACTGPGEASSIVDAMNRIAVESEVDGILASPRKSALTKDYCDGTEIGQQVLKLAAEREWDDSVILTRLADALDELAGNGDLETSLLIKELSR